MFSTDDKIKVLRREIAMRRAVYAGKVTLGRMTLEQADREIAVMVAILNDYEAGGMLVAAG